MEKSLDAHLWELVVNSIKAKADKIAIKLHILSDDDLIILRVSDNSSINGDIVPVKIIEGHGLFQLISVCERAGGFVEIKQDNIGVCVDCEMKILRFGFPDIGEIERAFRTMVFCNLQVEFDFDIKIK